MKDIYFLTLQQGINKKSGLLYYKKGKMCYIILKILHQLYLNIFI